MRMNGEALRASEVVPECRALILHEFNMPLLSLSRMLHGCLRVWTRGVFASFVRQRFRSWHQSCRIASAKSLPLLTLKLLVDKIITRALYAKILRARIIRCNADRRAIFIGRATLKQVMGCLFSVTYVTVHEEFPHHAFQWRSIPFWVSMQEKA